LKIGLGKNWIISVLEQKRIGGHCVRSPSERKVLVRGREAKSIFIEHTAVAFSLANS